MAPFFLYWDENTALTGNPLLQPAFTSNYQLQYSFKGSFIQVSYDDTVDSVSKFQNYFDETRNLLIVYPLNIDLQKTNFSFFADKKDILLKNIYGKLQDIHISDGDIKLEDLAKEINA